jgi:hypothetical protein
MLLFLLLSLVLPTAAAGAVVPGLYSLADKQTALIRYDDDGSSVTIGQLSIGGTPGPQNTAVVPETKTLYMLALNNSAPHTILIGVSLADASTTFEVPTPVKQVSSNIGVGQTIHYAEKGLVVTGIDKMSGLHTAWSVDPAQGHAFTELSSGFLKSSKPRVDNAHTVDPVHGVLWLTTTSPTQPQQVDLVGINLANGTELARHTCTSSTMPHAMEYDAASGKLLAFGLRQDAAFVFEIDTASFESKVLAKIDPKLKSRSVYNGISSFDSTSRTLYGLTSTTDNGVLLVGYSAATSAVTVATNLAGAVPFNIDFYAAPANMVAYSDPPTGGWGPAHSDLSCEHSPAIANLGKGLSVGGCKAACAASDSCTFINYAVAGDHECVLFADCSNPWCKSGAVGAWWTTFEYGRKGETPWTPCTAPPTPAPPGPAPSSSFNISVHPASTMDTVGPYMYGSGIETYNNCMYGGMWSNMLYDDSVEDAPAGSDGGEPRPLSPVPDNWYSSGAGSSLCAVQQGDAYNGAQSLVLAQGCKAINQGLAAVTEEASSMHFVGGRDYGGYVFLKSSVAGYGSSADGLDDGAAALPTVRVSLLCSALGDFLFNGSHAPETIGHVDLTLLPAAGDSAELPPTHPRAGRAPSPGWQMYNFTVGAAADCLQAEGRQGLVSVEVITPGWPAVALDKVQ